MAALPLIFPLATRVWGPKLSVAGTVNALAVKVPVAVEVAVPTVIPLRAKLTPSLWPNPCR